jgi:hypothetical protein
MGTAKGWGGAEMDRKISCAICHFRLSLDIGPGQTLSFSPDKLIYKRTCRRAKDPDFDFECADLWIAIESFLETPTKVGE